LTQVKKNSILIVLGQLLRVGGDRQRVVQLVVAIDRVARTHLHAHTGGSGVLRRTLEVQHFSPLSRWVSLSGT